MSVNYNWKIRIKKPAFVPAAPESLGTRIPSELGIVPNRCGGIRKTREGLRRSGNCADEAFGAERCLGQGAWQANTVGPLGSLRREGGDGPKSRWEEKLGQQRVLNGRLKGQGTKWIRLLPSWLFLWFAKRFKREGRDDGTCWIYRIFKNIFWWIFG